MDDILHRQDQKRRTMTTALFCSRKVSDARQGKGEEREHFIKRLTHLRLQDMGLTVVDNLQTTRKLQALYLNSNVITCMNGLQQKSLKQLLQLDLQDNDITVMEGLECLSGLKRLSVARNCISFVVGLEHCPKLEQLDISGQRLVQENACVEFDEASIDALSQQLVSLNASSCGLRHVEHLACLDNLKHLDISNNQLLQVTDFETVLLARSRRTGRNRALQTLSTTGNPAMKAGGPRVRDALVLMAESLQCLNGKDIEKRQRDFLLQMEARKSKPKKKKMPATQQNSNGGVLVETGNRPMAFEDASAYRKVQSGNKPLPGSYISGNGKRTGQAFR